jgi:hypothetical protein
MPGCQTHSLHFDDGEALNQYTSVLVLTQIYRTVEYG